jgi:hypothetical protein
MFSGKQSAVSQIKPCRPMRNDAAFLLWSTQCTVFVIKILRGQSRRFAEPLVCFGVRDE